MAAPAPAPGHGLPTRASSANLSGAGGEHLAMINMEFSQKHAAFAKDFVVPSLLRAGLEVNGFCGSLRPDVNERPVILQVTATAKRLLQEAERLNWNLQLDSEKLRDADVKENRRLVVEEGLNFNPAGNDSEHMEDLSIPRLDALCTKGRDPYQFIYGPYRADKHGLYRVHASTGTVLTQGDALQLLKSIMEAPDDPSTRGAGLVLDRMVAKKRMAKYWAQHDPAQRDRLERDWNGWWAAVMRPPLHELYQYYAPKVAFYFAFLNFQTRMLVVPAIVGLIVFIVEMAKGGAVGTTVLSPLYGIFTPLWCTVFYELWKREQGDRSMKWGMAAWRKAEPLRPEYTSSKHVQRTRSFVDGKVTYYASPTTYRARLTASASFVSIFMCALVAIVIGIFWLRVVLAAKIAADWSTRVTSIINAVQITIMSYAYSWLARKLNDFENHPTDSMYDNALIVKQAVFQTVNCFFNLMWTAGVRNFFTIEGTSQACPPSANSAGQPDCMPELANQLAVLLVMRIIISNFNEVVLPRLLNILQRVFMIFTARSAVTGEGGNAAVKDYEASLSPVEKEGRLVPYDPFDDYLEAVLLFGFLTLFVPSFTLCPIIGWLATLAEAKLDTHKVLFDCARPMPSGASDIGAWGIVLEMYVNLSTITCLAVVAFTYGGPVWGKYMSLADRLMFFTTALILLFAIKWAVATLIPDRTYSTQLQLDRQQYLSDKHILGVKDMQVAKDSDADAGAGPAGTGAGSSSAPGDGAGAAVDPGASARNLDGAAGGVNPLPGRGGFTLYPDYATMQLALSGARPVSVVPAAMGGAGGSGPAVVQVASPYVSATGASSGGAAAPALPVVMDSVPQLPVPPPPAPAGSYPVAGYPQMPQQQHAAPAHHTGGSHGRYGSAV